MFSINPPRFNKQRFLKHSAAIFQALLFALSLSVVASDSVAESENPAGINFDPLVITGTQPAIDYPLNAPLTVTEFDAESIAELAIDSAQASAVYVPNFKQMDAGSNSLGDRSNMRGLMDTPLFTTPAIVLYLDDAPMLSTFAEFNRLHNVETIEVYRGPQGGLFGRNSYAGVINVKSRRPSNRWQGNVTVDKGNFDALNIHSRIDGALMKDRLFVALGVAYSEREGYLDNTLRDRDGDFQEHLSGHINLLWTPNDNWQFDLKAGALNFNDGAIRLISLSGRQHDETRANEPEHQDQQGHHQTLKISYIDDVIEFLSITARRATDTGHVIDLDASPLPLLAQDFFLRQQQWTQEFRVTSLLESDWRGSFGLFYANNDVTGNITNSSLGRTGEQNIRTLDEITYAGFAQLSYQGFDALRIFLDLRLDYTRKKINRRFRNLFNITSDLKEQRSDSFFSPKLTLDYALTPQVSVYGSTRLAFKPGGYSARSDRFPEFDKESLWANEIGVNSTWFNQRISADLALFYYQIEDYQLEDFFSIFDYSVVNAPEVEIYGGEIDLTVKVTEQFSLKALAGYSHSRFQRYQDPVTGIDYQDNKVPYIPEFNANIAAQYRHPNGFYARADLLWTGKTYFDAVNSETFAEPDYLTVNALAGFRYRQVDINAYVKNLTDAQYFTSKTPVVNLGVPNKPRTFGVRLGLNF